MENFRMTTEGKKYCKPPGRTKLSAEDRTGFRRILIGQFCTFFREDKNITSLSRNRSSLRPPTLGRVALFSVNKKIHE
jgi:hypothetical protein